MGKSKRLHAIWEAEAKAEEESRRKNPPPAPPPWSSAQLAELDQMRAALDKLRFEQPHDINLVYEFLRFSYYFEENSYRLSLLRDRAAHYLKLKQETAKEKQWSKIQENFSSLSTELEWVRKSRERGGTGVQ